MYMCYSVKSRQQVENKFPGAKLNVDKKKEIKKEDDDTFSYDDKLDVVPPSSSKSSFFAFKEVLKSLGPGVITGAANEDPTTVATYSHGRLI
jgi:hypothetical protein